jgi:hypothetical protein
MPFPPAGAVDPAPREWGHMGIRLRSEQARMFVGPPSQSDHERAHRSQAAADLAKAQETGLARNSTLQSSNISPVFLSIGGSL